MEPYYAEALALVYPKRRRDALSCSQREKALQSLGAGLLLRKLLSVRSDGDLSYNSYGKPCLAKGGPCFSLSHSGDYVLLGWGEKELGVDIEKLRPVRDALIKRCCREEELTYIKEEQSLQRFFTLYTRKESAMKAAGLGFSLPLREINALAAFSYENTLYRFASFSIDGYAFSVASSEETALKAYTLLTVGELL